MGDRRTGDAALDFLPQRTETLRESFQEKMRQKGGHRPPRPAEGPASVRLLSLDHGAHPGIERFNEHFRPGAAKLKATLDVLGHPAPDTPLPALLPLLVGLFPNLPRHRCCGGNDIHSTLFLRRARPGCALPPVNHGTDFCHLLEHLALELVVAVGPATRCSGLTCGHKDPPHRFDLFLECEDARVGAAAIRCAAHVIHVALARGELPPGATRYAETARYFLGRPRSYLNPGDVLVHLQGDPVRLEEAIRFLATAGFLEEQRFALDFGGTVAYRYRLATDLPPLPADLTA
jgi:hypothetical protein